MAQTLNRKAIWGWMFFDFASQPYFTLLLTFIFGPYFVAHVMTDAESAQVAWSFTIGAAGAVMAVLGPILGAIADSTGPRKPWIFGFSIFYVIGACGLWLAVPAMDDTTLILVLFAVGLVAAEFATIFSNAMLPDLVPRGEVGRVSGSGWGFGYIGGLIILAAVLTLVAENESGKTLIGIDPIGGLDPATREGTRSAGPITAVWYVLFMIPFFLWVPDVRRRARVTNAVSRSLAELWGTIRALPSRPSFLNFLLSSMFYRDALNALYALGGIYAVGVLGWSVVQIGTFGILAAAFGAVGAWAGGRADKARGPMPVVMVSILALLAVCIICFGTSREAVFWVPVAAGSSMPDLVFYFCGIVIGAAGGSLQASSRTLVVVQGDPARMTEAFGLYALAGKSTAFLAPWAIAVTTAMTDSQHIGIFAPVIFLLVLGFVLLLFVSSQNQGEKAHA